MVVSRWGRWSGGQCRGLGRARPGVAGARRSDGWCRWPEWRSRGWCRASRERGRRARLGRGRGGSGRAVGGVTRCWSAGAAGLGSVAVGGPVGAVGGAGVVPVRRGRICRCRRDEGCRRRFRLRCRGHGGGNGRFGRGSCWRGCEVLGGFVCWCGRKGFWTACRPSGVGWGPGLMLPSGPLSQARARREGRAGGRGGVPSAAAAISTATGSCGGTAPGVALGAELDQIPELSAGVRDAVGGGLDEVPAQFGCVCGVVSSAWCGPRVRGGVPLDGGVDQLFECVAGPVQRRRAGARQGVWCSRVRVGGGCSLLVQRALS